MPIFNIIALVICLALFAAFLGCLLVPSRLYGPVRDEILRWLLLGTIVAAAAWLVVSQACAETSPPPPPLPLLDPCPGGIPDPTLEHGCKFPDSTSLRPLDKHTIHT